MAKAKTTAEKKAKTTAEPVVENDAASQDNGTITSKDVNDANFKKSGSVAATTAKKGVKKITFRLHSGRTRVFTEADHGEDFAAVADEFHKSNEKSDENRGARKDHVVARSDE